jgi:hypothetical protein
MIKSHCMIVIPWPGRQADWHVRQTGIAITPFFLPAASTLALERERECLTPQPLPVPAYTRQLAMQKWVNLVDVVVVGESVLTWAGMNVGFCIGPLLSGIRLYIIPKHRLSLATVNTVGQKRRGR